MYGNFEDKESFVSYYTQHYKPLLERLVENETIRKELPTKDSTLLQLLKDDLNAIFKENEND